MVDCRYKRNKKKTACKKKIKKGKKKYTQKQSQKQIVNIHIHQKKTKKTKKTTRRRQHPRIPRVNAGASHIPLIINNNMPQARTQNDYQVGLLRQELLSQRNRMNEMMEFNKLKFGETIAMKNNINLMTNRLQQQGIKTQETILGLTKEQMRTRSDVREAGLIQEKIRVDIEDKNERLFNHINTIKADVKGQGKIIRDDIKQRDVLLEEHRNEVKKEFIKQEEKIDNLFEFNKIKYGENLAMKEKIREMEQIKPLTFELQENINFTNEPQIIPNDRDKRIMATTREKLSNLTIPELQRRAELYKKDKPNNKEAPANRAGKSIWVQFNQTF